ncbi:hypothetical protein AWB98_01280 [Mycolicibacterium conceptionense]|uniref:MuF-like minor capsid protein n=2 Tax=Mycolicibacterium conceptionense TaxID=451644 RepID=A0ABX3UZR5_9MYCO|nr:hypothetical protein [Mycolicibacterium conceptionense]ORV20959.1 hypothetical protein AWB98_01280 [Mycolicibacterium conceptionense]
MSPTLAEYVSVVTAAASEQLSPIWTGLAVTEAVGALHDLVPSLIDTYALAAGSLAADWYDDHREEKAIKGRFTALVPDLGDLGARQLVDWAVQPLTDLDEPDWNAARTRTEGGMQRRIAKASRETVMISALTDPQALGWQRVARSDGCPFCVMLAGRGAVYSERSVKFGAHDHCSCSATPAWGGEPLPVKPFTPSARNISDADRARVRDWIDANDLGNTKADKANRSSGKRTAAPSESKAEIAKRQLPALEQSLKDLRAKGLPDSSPQIQYHLAQIAKFRRQLKR